MLCALPRATWLAYEKPGHQSWDFLTTQADRLQVHVDVPLRQYLFHVRVTLGPITRRPEFRDHGLIVLVSL